MVRRKVTVQLEVEFDDKDLPTPDVDEALVNAVVDLKSKLLFLPAFTGTSSRKRKVSFRLKDMEVVR